jgi:hypothetical protein
MAVIAHTEMAMKMISDGHLSLLNSDLVRDIVAYSAGEEFFNNYVDKYYDSSADYYRMYKDKNGQVLRVEDDGDIYHVTIVEADGSEQKVKLQQGSISEAIAVAASNGISKKEMNDIMVKSGLDYNENKGWFAVGEEGLYKPSIEQIPVSEQNPNTTPWYTTAVEGVSNFFDKAGNMASKVIEKGLYYLGEGLKSQRGLDDALFMLYEAQLKQPEKVLDSPIDTNGYVTVSNGSSYNYFNSIIDDATMKKYSAQENNGQTQCGTYVRDTVKSTLGEDIYNRIFEGRIENTNTMFESFKVNPNLERIEVPDYNNLRAIQDIADSGRLVIMIYQNLSDAGHIAFIGHSNMVYNTNYEKAPHYNGLKLSDLDNHHLTVVHAGTFPGVTSIVYATSGWNDREKRIDLLKNNLSFYTVKGK